MDLPVRWGRHLVNDASLSCAEVGSRRGSRRCCAVNQPVHGLQTVDGHESVVVIVGTVDTRRQRGAVDVRATTAGYPATVATGVAAAAATAAAAVAGSSTTEASF